MPRKEREFAKKGRCLPPLTSGRSRIPAPRGAREAVMAEVHGSRTHRRHVAMPPNGFEVRGAHRDSSAPVWPY